MPTQSKPAARLHRLGRPLNRLVLMMMVCGAALGCRGNDSDRQLIHREMRWLEDEIYHLEDELEASDARLKSCRRENDALRQELNGSAGDGETDREEDLLPPRINVPDLPRFDGPSGDSAPPFGPAPTSDETSDETTDGPEATLQLPNFSRRRRPGTSNRSVVRVRFNRRLTGGFDADGRPGDEGVMVVLEPRNADGELVETGADVALYVNDPALPADRRTVARWNFTADEVAAHYRETPMGTGVHFKLPWPNEPPRNQSLELLVRCATPGGREIVAERTIDVDLDSARQAAWTESTARQQRSASARGRLGRFARNTKKRLAATPDESGWNRSKNRPEDIDLLVRRRDTRTPDNWTTSPALAEQPRTLATPSVAQPPPEEPAAAEIQPVTVEAAANTEKETGPTPPRWRPYR